MNEIIKSIIRITERTGKIPLGLIILIMLMLAIFGYFSVQNGVDTMIERLPQILEQLVKSPLGIFALMIIAISLLGYYFFREASEESRMVIFILMFLGVTAFGVAITLSIQHSVNISEKIILPISEPLSTPVLLMTPPPIPVPSPILTPTLVPPPTSIPLPVTDIAVFVVSQYNTIDTDMSQMIVSILQTRNKKAMILPSDRLRLQNTFDTIFQGNTEEVKRAGWEEYSRYVILGKKAVVFTDNPQLENTKTANITLELHMVSSVTGVLEDSFTLTTNGVGFSEVDAEKVALERMLSQLNERVLNNIH